MTRLLVVACLCVLGVLGFVRADDDHGENADQYTTEQFKENVPKSPHFVMFYAPWCGHCKRLAPTFDQLGTKYNVEGERKVATIAKVDCTQETALCSDQGVTGYPTLKFFKADVDAEKYRGSRDFDTLNKYIQEQLGGGEEEKKKAPILPSPATRNDDGLYDLTGETFLPHVAAGFHFIKFFAPWCGHCKRLAPTWDDLAKHFKDNDQIRISKIDCTQHGATCQKYEVKGYPTLLFFKDGKKLEKYAGSRELEALRDQVYKLSGQAPSAAGKEEKVPPKTEAPKEGEAAVPGMSVLNVNNFKSTVEGKKAFVKFYAPWCGHCKRLAPAWDDLAAFYKDKDVIIGKVDCTVDRQLCTDNEVRGYPTLLFFEDGKSEKYSSGRELENLKQFVDKKLNIASPPEPKEPEDGGEDFVIALTDDNFEDQIGEGVVFIMFYAPWCGHCKKLAPTWKGLASAFKDNPEVRIAKVDCTSEKKVCKNEEINGFPTLVLYRNGEDVAEHEGGRDILSLKSFVLDTVAAEIKADEELDKQKEEL